MEFSRVYFTKRILNKVSRYCVAFILMISFILLILKHLGYPLSGLDAALASCTKTLLFICTMYFIKTYKRDLFQ